MGSIETSIEELAAMSSRVANEAVTVVRLGKLVREHDASCELARRNFDTQCDLARDIFLRGVKQLWQEVCAHTEESDYDEYDDEDAPF